MGNQHIHIAIREDKQMVQKEKYESPELEIVFRSEDIIRTSGGIDLPPDEWDLI